MSEHFSQESEFEADLPEADPAEGSDLESAGDLVDDSDAVAAETHDVAEGSDAEGGEVPAPDAEPAPPTSDPESGPDGGGAPETGDLVIDAALRDLADAPVDDLDAQIERGEQVQRTLQGRLSDLGG